MVLLPVGRREGYLLNSVPPELRTALEAETAARDTSLTNVAGEALAAHYGLAFESSGRPLQGFQGGSSLYLRLPPAVMEAVRGEAAERETTQRWVILAALCGRFSLEPPPLKRVPSKARAGRPRGKHWKHGRPRGRQKGAKA